MSSDLKKLFEFEFIIIDLQKKIVEMRGKGVSESVLEPSMERIDKLIEIYKYFDHYYSDAVISRQKILKLESDILIMAEKIIELEKESTKLLKTLAFNGS